MIKIHDITYIGFEDDLELWKTIDFKDVKPDKYEVSSLGRVRIKNGKILNGNNPKNENGYCRVALLNIDNKVKKYAVHRLVLNAFGDYDDSLEVNHIDGNPLNNYIGNLEKTTRQENAHHAMVHNLYQSCEDHYKSIFTNEEVHKICYLASKGKPVSEIIKIMGLKNRGYSIYSNIDKILSGETYKSISIQYDIDWNKYHYKTYSYEDIHKMCDCIFNKNMKNKDIVKLFPQYNEHNLKTALKSIRAHRTYKKIIREYITFND